MKLIKFNTPVPKNTARLIINNGGIINTYQTTGSTEFKLLSAINQAFFLTAKIRRPNRIKPKTADGASLAQGVTYAAH